MAAAVAAFGFCADAQADSLTRSGGVLTYTGDPTQSSSVTVGYFSGDVEFDANRVISPLPADCTPVTMAGDWVSCDQAVTRVDVDLGGANDFASGAELEVPMRIRGGEGGDDLRGGRLADDIDGEGGSDTLTGDAWFAGSPMSHDDLDGGAGNDWLRGAEGRDVLRGGAGIDAARYDDGLRVATDRLFLSIDGVANDGAASESDNILTDVEDLYGRDGADVLIGSSAANTLVGGAGGDRLVGGGGFDAFDAGAGADTVEARDGLAEEVNCGEDGDGGPVDAIDVLSSCEATVPSTALQPDADGDGLDDPADCDDANPAIRPGAVDVPDNGIDEDCRGGDAVDLDRDGDGIPRPLDCDDANAKIKPGAKDKRGNKVDEDCKGGPAPYLHVKATVANRWAVFPDFTRVLQLRVSGTGAKPKVVVLCKGGGCPFGKKKFKVRKPSRPLKLEGAFAGRSLQPGARVEVRVQRPKMIAKIVRYTIRDGKGPKSKTLCLAPGTNKPKAC